jgi:hypothetical protein
MYRQGNNPWVTEQMYGFVAQAFDEDGVYYDHLESADRKPSIKCSDGHTTYFNPTVGAYVCQTCWDTKRKLT